MIMVRVYIMECRCGFAPLGTHRTYEKACRAAQAHKDLNPDRCEPTITYDDVPAGLA